MGKAVNEELFAKEGEATPDPGKVMQGIKWTNGLSEDYAKALGNIVEGIVKTDSLKGSTFMIDTRIRDTQRMLARIKGTMPKEFADTMAEQRVDDYNRAIVELIKGFQARLNRGEFEKPKDALQYFRKNVIEEAARSFDALFGTKLRKKILKAA